MLDLYSRSPALHPSPISMLGSPRAPSLPANGGYHGPERRSAASHGARWLALMLDEVDYGMLLLGDDGSVLHVNHSARTELDSQHPLRIDGRSLHARSPQDATALHEALQAARRGLRRLLTLGPRNAPTSVAVVPLGTRATLTPANAPATLLLLSKKRVCERLSAQWFARCHALTPAETRVLEALCQGLDPREIAEQGGVGLATVRTQIGAIRSKTGADSIRDLVQRVAVLPPMLSTLRTAA
ncbi:MAG TPA: helix-turn-helix transcriptional regulator [Rubrivivax sp.]|nr:helix-turn-helix transcriptional regulator [Rubrivivax sp.]